MRRGDGTRCRVPATEGGLGGRRTSGSCSFVFQHGMFCVEFRVLVHHASISGGVCAVRGCGWGVCGNGRAWVGRGRSSVCAVTRVSTSLRAPLRERFCPCTHGSPRRPPHADARNWGRHRSLPPSPPRARNGLGGAAQACAEEAGGEAGRVVENGAPALVGPASDARGQLGRDQKASAKGRGKTTQWRAARG